MKQISSARWRYSVAHGKAPDRQVEFHRLSCALLEKRMRRQLMPEPSDALSKLQTLTLFRPIRSLQCSWGHRLNLIVFRISKKHWSCVRNTSFPVFLWISSFLGRAHRQPVCLRSTDKKWVFVFSIFYAAAISTSKSPKTSSTCCFR